MVHRATGPILPGSRISCSTVRRSESARKFARPRGSSTCAAPTGGGARALCSAVGFSVKYCAFYDPIAHPWRSSGVGASFSCVICSRSSLRQISLYAVRVEGGWGDGETPSPQPLALYYRVKTRVPEVASAQTQRFAVPCQFQIPKADGPMLCRRPYRTLPINCARRKPSIVLLIVEQRFEVELAATCADVPLHRIADSSSRRNPTPPGAEFNIRRLQNLHAPVAAAQCAARPTLL